MHTRDLEALAAVAWNKTKSDDDPPFAGCAMDHRLKLVAAARSIYETDTAGIQGLEKFEEYVLAEVIKYRQEQAEKASAGDQPPKQLTPAPPKTGKLPEDFPGHAALEAAGITTYAKARAVSDLTTIPGIGEATAAAITEALKEA